MPQPRFRPARREDCAAIAALFRISSDGIADYIWTQLAQPGEDILAVGRRRYEREDSAFSYRNCTLVEDEAGIIGMLVAFPMHSEQTGEQNDPVLAPYSTLEVDRSYYISGMALLPEHRGRGIGARLLQLAEEQAREQGYKALSLIVFEQNSGAKRLYERYGYREVKRATVYPHPLIRYTGDAVLMLKALA